MTARTPFLLLASGALVAVASAQVANDECANADVLTLGMTPFDTTLATNSAPPWTCAGSSTSPDIWYVFTTPNDANYTFETCGSSYDTALSLYDGTCGALNLLQCNDDSCGLSSRVLVTATAGTTLYLRVGGFGGSSLGPGTITVIELAPRPVALVAHYKMDDAGTTCEDSSGNNLSGTYMGGQQGVAGASPATGTAVDFGGLGDFVEIPAQPALDDLLNDLSVSVWVYLDGPSVSNTNGSTLHRLFGNTGPSGSWSIGVDDTTGQILFTTHGVLDYYVSAPIVQNRWLHVAAVMDIDNDVTIYLDGAAVGTVAGAATASTPSGTYNIAAWWPNSATVPQFTNGKVDDVQVYGGALTAADVMGLFTNPGSTVGGTSIGTRYCSPALANSTGVGALMNVDGSTLVANNDVTLSTTQMPTNAFGFFLTSRTQGLVMMPGGSQGNLCLTGAIGRYVGMGQIQNSGAAGEMSLVIDLGLVPTPTGLVQAQPGETWNYTAWFRDAVSGSATSNFADGVEVTFQ